MAQIKQIKQMQLQRKKVLGGEKDGADIAEPKSGATSLPLVTAPEKSPGILESQIEHIFAHIKKQIRYLNADPKFGATSLPLTSANFMQSPKQSSGILGS